MSDLETVTIEAPAATPARPKRRSPAKRKVARKAPRKARTASKARTNKGRKFSFARIHLRPGTVLRSVFFPALKVTVASDRTIKMHGQEMTLSAAAKKLAHKKGKKWPTIQGPMYFTYKGEKLAELVH